MTTKLTSPLFSVITVSKNNLEGLRRTHASLEAQVCKDFEWIIADGASEDGTKDFLKTV
ncbi:MAG: glycosyltransferase, partial [Alphaproteobacteria bacterium]|nr:glycosyltransferase [Alphaproteobacteria bacterium]